MTATIKTSALLASLKAVGESTRLRILMLLLDGELTVKDLTRILGQSQPRISRHLKLLVEADLIERFREGSWVYFRLGEGLAARPVQGLLTGCVDRADPILLRDRERAMDVKRGRVEIAQAYFRAHAAEWDAIRSLHVAEEQVEQAVLEAVGQGPFELLVDLGTGTGRILELLASRVRRGVGIDVNQAMLGCARANIERAGLTNCHVRLGDLFDIPLNAGTADLVVIHQVLHFVEDPAQAVREAVRLLRPGGRLLVVDFAPHELEFVRESHAHQRLGFSSEQMRQWMMQAGLETGSTCRDLAPPDPDGARKLTVSLWLGTVPLLRHEAGAGKKVEVAA